MSAYVVFISCPEVSQSRSVPSSQTIIYFFLERCMFLARSSSSGNIFHCSVPRSGKLNLTTFSFNHFLFELFSVLYFSVFFLLFILFLSYFIMYIYDMYFFVGFMCLYISDAVQTLRIRLLFSYFKSSRSLKNYPYYYS